MEEILSLIRLLDDSDPQISLAVSEKLRQYGKEAMPSLEKAWEDCFEVYLREKLEELIHLIQFDILKSDIQKWYQNEQNDLLKGVYLISKFQESDLELKDIETKIEQIKYDVWIELAEHLTALEQVKVLNHVLFEIYKFHGNIKNYYSPKNSNLNQVLESKRGNPISLAIIYSIIAQRLNIPIYGVNLPKNFVLAYIDENQLNKQIPLQEISVLFYINPFNRGLVFGKKEIDYYLDQQKIKSMPEFYMACSNLDIIKRIVQNLLFSYQQVSDKEKIEEIMEIQKILSEKF